MKIAVCVPHTGMIRAKCAQALNDLVAHTLSCRINYNGAIVQPKFAFLYAGKGPLEYKRTRLAQRALEWGADYQLLIDWDHTFPPDALLRLAGHDLPFVAADYPSRHETRRPVAIGAEGRHGVEPVAAVGLGFALIKSEVFAAAPKPWFLNSFDENGQFLCGEDIHFCNQVRAAGVPIHVDHGLIIGHIAETVLTLGGEGSNADTVLPATGTE